MAWIIVGNGHHNTWAKCVNDDLVCSGKYVFACKSKNTQNYTITQRFGGNLLRTYGSLEKAVGLSNWLDSHPRIDWVALRETARSKNRTGVAVNHEDIKTLVKAIKEFESLYIGRYSGADLLTWIDELETELKDPDVTYTDGYFEISHTIRFLRNKLYELGTE